jgi:3-phosphoshikimate 1-carboxyvinyltransferase
MAADAMDVIEITPASGPLAATVMLPGSKSLTNRAMLLAAMARGRSVINGALLSDDTQRMATALRTLGFEVVIDVAARRIAVIGLGGEIPSHAANLDAGNAGTAMRFLAGFLSLGHGRYRLDGSPRMRERPIEPLLEALRALGIAATSESGNGCPPIVIDLNAGCAGGAVTIDASLSSQFASALLMPAPLWPRGLRLTVPGETARPFIEMTTRLMDRWGIRSTVSGDVITVSGGQSYHPTDFAIEPDATAASYFGAAAAIVGGSVTLRGLGRDSMQGDVAFFAILEQMGAHIEWRAEGVTVSGAGELRGVDVAMNAIPDTVPTLAAIAPFATTPTRIRAVAFIRHHESDRLHAIATELRRLGAAVEEFDDGLGIAPSPMRPATIATYDDHRIAMAFAIIGLKLPGVRIENPGCVAKTYPEFFRDLAAF